MRTRLLSIFIVCLTLGLFVKSNIHAQSTKELYLNNRAPLLSKPYMELPLGTIKPEGWLKEQLIRMKNGMTGHLDSLYPTVMGARNGWLGGDGDVWERGPYWIDGLLPLAYILNDQSLIDKVQPWIEWTLHSQQPNGYFGPFEDRSPEKGIQRTNARDWWPKMVVLKFMQQYYSATGDQRVITFMTNYFKYQLNELPKTPLNHWTDWGQRRGGDNLMEVYWLYNITGNPFLLNLGELITQQTTNWTDLFLHQENTFNLFNLHGVNLGQAIKEPILVYQANQDPKQIEAIKQGTASLKKNHGFPTGLYGADEMLHTGNPTQGSELCTAVELMFSLEKMIEITGKTEYADWLERIAFNALPTQVTDNFDARQYYQQVNQIQITRQNRNFVTCYNGTDQLFGLLDGYPCCTANLHQGWPKFTQHLWYASKDRGLAALVYSPSSVTAKVGKGIKVHIKENTNYPFEESVHFEVSILDKKIKSVAFPLHFRIPYWCKKAYIKINGLLSDSLLVAGTTVQVYRNWESGDLVELDLPMTITISRWYENAASVERGPLLYALRMNEHWKKIKDDQKFGTRYGNEYYEVTSNSPWNYCLLNQTIEPDSIAIYFKINEKKVTGYPWNLENAPITIKAKAKRMPQWKQYNGSAGPLPFSPQYQATLDPEEDITLIPYGCTTLRIAEFPVTVK